MLTVLWSPKGGTGTSVVAAALAVGCAGRGGDPVVLVDLGGDLADVLGVDDPGPGVSDWLASRAGGDALDRLLVPVRANLLLLGPGDPGALDGADPARIEHLCRCLGRRGVEVVVDLGRPGRICTLHESVIGAADRSVVVLRACYLTMRRFLRCGLRADAVVVVREVRRALDPTDVGEVVGLPVVAVVDHDPAVARAVDAGSFARRAPAPLIRSLRRVA